MTAGTRHGAKQRTLEAGQNGNELAGPIVGGRYHVERLLRKCLVGANWLGSDRVTGDAVVIKAAPTSELAASAALRLEHEAELRRQVESAWVAPLLDVCREDECFYLISRYIPGVALSDRLQQSPLSLREALTVGTCLFSALMELHRARILHRDIRPLNIIVPALGDCTSATLIDIGVVEPASADALVRRQQLEHAWYVSPEQAGSIDRDVGEPADLYSAGVVLFECLAGRPPFLGDSVGAVLFEHVTASIPELRSLGVEAPRALDAIVQRLLRKDPSDRYQTAAAVLHDLQTLIESLDRGDREPSVAIGSHDRRCTLTEPAFVARRRELHLLEEQTAAARRGQAGLVLVEGRSGNGKSRLLVELAQRAARDGLWVLQGQATTEVGQRPFRMLEGVVERFVAAGRADPGFVAAVRQKLGPRCDAVCDALPQLRTVLPLSDAPENAPEAFGEARTIRALGEFLDALGDAGRPVLLILDDCQWADELTIKLLNRWQATEGAARPRYLMVVAAFRSDETPPDHLLRRLEAAAHLQLDPLEPDDVRRLAESMAGPLPAEALDIVTRLGEGSPFMASAVLRGLVESGALVAIPGGWRIEPQAMASLQSSRHAAAILARRIDLLPAPTLQLLSTAAVLGKEFDLDAAARLAQQSSFAAIDALDDARRRQLVWARPDGGHFVFVHDKIRSAFLQRLSDEERKQLHRAVALRLQRVAPERASDLAYHFDAAGDRENALRYALDAAEKARAQHSLEVAEQQYRIARRGADAADGATQFRIAEGLGDVLMLRGKYDAAAPLFELAERLAEDALSQAEIREKIAELAFKRGDKETATRQFEATLRRLGCYVPRSLPVFAMLLVVEAVIQVLHSLLPRWLVHRRKETPSAAVRLQLRLFSRLTHGYWFTRGKTQTLWAHLRGMNLGECYPPTLELANTYSEHAPVISLVPMFRRACAYSQRSLEIRKSFGDLWGQGQSLTFYSCVLYYSSRYQECIEKSREAIRLLERMGDYWLVHIARYQLAASLYRLGDFRGALEQCRLNHRSGLELQDEQASGIILDVWTRASGGEVPSEILQTELRRERQDAQGATQVLFAEGVRLLGAGRCEHAAEVFRSAIEVAHRAGVNNAYTLPSQTWLAAALRQQAEQADPYQHSRRRTILRAAATAARRAVRASRICRNDLPQAYREYALISALQGRQDLAWRCFAKSLDVAERHHARYEYAQTLAARGRIGNLLGWPQSGVDCATAEALLQELAPDGSAARNRDAERAAPVTLSLADRFDTVLSAGRKIASALAKAAIYEEARAAALRLLRGEDCQIVELDVRESSATITWASDRNVEGYIKRLAQNAVYAGRAVAVTVETDGLPADQAEPSSGCSVICVPIHVRGRTAACLYATHRHVRGLFGPDEERLADFIAAIAGAALENAEGFQQLESLNETLEERVAERTAAAEVRAQELAASNRELERVADELRRTEEQLRVAIDAAESASRAKTQFLTTMSHEIRTPMNGILGMTELALNTPLSEQQRNYLNVVKQSGDSLLALLNDILDLSKIEAGRMDLEVIPFRVREVVSGAVNLLSVTATQKGIGLSCHIAPELPAEICGDPTRLRQILVNLVGNAIKFTSVGQVTVSVNVESAVSGAQQLRLTVRDTGIGIPADKLESIFESFQQADSSTTRRYGGTGLGLSISAQLASLMGGRLWAESQIGCGSTFHVVVPLVAADNASHAAPPDAETAAPTPRSRALHILLAEDGAINQEVAIGLLGMAGHTVEAAENGREALEVYQRGAFDVILMDLEMPELDGLEATRRIREYESATGERTPIIAMTAHAVHGFRERCLEAGMDDYITKPIEYKELLRALEYAVAKTSRSLTIAT